MARQFYVEYLDLHAQLQWRTRGKSDGLTSPPQPASVARSRRSTRQLVWASLAAVASLAAAAAVFIALFVPRSVPEEAETPDLPMKPVGAVAVLIENGPAVWEPGSSRPKTGSYLLPGRLKLKSGVVEVAFERGGKVLLEGPGDLEISAADRGFLHRGKLAAKVVDRTAPLIVNLPGGVANIDGECGVLFDDAGQPEVHVFTGEARTDLSDARGQPLPGGRLIEHAAAAINATEHLLTDVPLNYVAFAHLRPDVWISDAAVRDGSHADENFGAAPQLAVKNSIAGYSWETFLEFDLSGVKEPVVAATIRLIPIHVGQPMENAAAIVPSDEAWTEQSITWATKPHSHATLATWTVADRTPVEIDVTQHVREALVGERRIGLRIFAPHRKRGSAYVQYGSREGDPATRPQLIIKLVGDLQSRIGAPMPVASDRLFSLPVAWALQSPLGMSLRNPREQ